MVCEEKKCCGCGGCVDVCPQKCITMKVKPDGFLYPTIQEGGCIHCNLCREVCPQISKMEKWTVKKCFAAYDNTHEDRLDSASGGIGRIVYDSFLQINTNSEIIGVEFDLENHAKFEITSERSKIPGFQGSKYVQADHNNIFLKIAAELKAGKKVCFIALPCQIAAGINYCRVKNINTENLLTVDLLCHGVSSQEYLKEELDFLKEKKRWQAVNKLTFRSNRKFRDFHFYIEYTAKNGKTKIYNRYSDEDPYFHSFLSGISLRESCCSCQFATLNRVGDITIGDYIGLGKMSSSPVFTGNAISTSMILCNTTNGEAFLNRIGKQISIFERPFQEAVEGGASLQKPFACSKKRSDFFEKYELGKFVETVHTVADAELRRNRLRRVPRRIIGQILLRFRRK